MVQIKPPPPPEPPIGFLFELKMGTFIPRVGDEPGLTSNPYETVFGNKSMLYGGGEIDFIAWHGYGAVTVGFAAGYSEKYGPALLQSNGDALQREDRAHRLPAAAPGRLPVRRHLDPVGHPLRPLREGRAAGHALASDQGRDDRGGERASRATGLKWGYGFTGGVAFILDVLSAQMAKDMTTDTGIRHSYIFAEYNHDQIDDFGKVGLNLSSRYFTFGLGFEF